MATQYIVIGMVPLAIVVGTCLGFLQWIILRRYIRQSGWWTTSSIIGATASTPAAMAMIMITLGYTDWPLSSAMPLCLASVLAVSVFGAITGAAIAWLWRQPVSETQEGVPR